MKKNIFSYIALATLLIGIGLISYPSLSNWLSSRNHTQLIEDYKDEIMLLTAEKKQGEIQKARTYNEMIYGINIKDPFDNDGSSELTETYLSTLNLRDMMGYINIPKININIPIYHGTSNEVLDKGIGHIFGTSIPVGGEGTHAVLTGHRGLSSSKLFTDLDLMEINDIFYIHVLDDILVYQVDQILVVLPNETNELRAVAGEDYVTLVTCTPYAINSHRLFVRGTRIPYAEPKENESLKYPWYYWLLIIPVLTPSAVVGIYYYKKYSKTKKRK